MSIRGFNLSALTAACLLTGGLAASLPAAASDLNELAAGSRAVVHSRVSKVEYTFSEAGLKGQGAVPHTVVTFDVVKAVSGNVGTSSFTLRFIGGPDGRGRFMRASNVPVFQAGDEDILFLREANAKGCALAGCIDGRFRVLNGLVYDGTGAPVQRVDGSRVVVGGEMPAELGTFRYPRPAFDDLLKNPEAREALRQRGLTVAEARRRYEAEAPAMIEMSSQRGGAQAADIAGSGGQGSTSEARAANRTMLADNFVASLAGLKLASAEGAFQGVDAAAAIAAPSTKATAPAKVEAARLPARPAADLAEERALPKDDASITRNKAQ